MTEVWKCHSLKTHFLSDSWHFLNIWRPTKAQFHPSFGLSGFTTGVVGRKDLLIDLARDFDGQTVFRRTPLAAGAEVQQETKRPHLLGKDGSGYPRILFCGRLGTVDSQD